MLPEGVGYDKNTSLHLADVRAEYPGKHMETDSSAVLEDGKRVWKTYETLYVDGEDFTEIGEAFEHLCAVKGKTLGKTTLGAGTITLMRQRDIVDFAVTWIGNNRK